MKLSRPPKDIITSAGLSNWDEIAQWAQVNDPIFRRAFTESRILGLSELEALKLIASSLLESKLLAQELYINIAVRSSISKWFPNGN